MLTRIVIFSLLGFDSAVLTATVLAGHRGFLTLVGFVLALHILVSILAMRLLIRFFPVPNGEFEHGTRGFDRWQARAFLSMLSCNLFDRILPIFVRAQWYMLFGAKLPWTARIAGRIVDCSLVEMEADTLLGEDGLIVGHYQLGNRIRVGRVRIRRGATVGLRAVVFPGVEVGEQATVGAGALVTADCHIPADETWAGVPAKRLKAASSSQPETHVMPSLLLESKPLS